MLSSASALLDPVPTWEPLGRHFIDTLNTSVRCVKCRCRRPALKTKRGPEEKPPEAPSIEDGTVEPRACAPLSGPGPEERKNDGTALDRDLS